MKLFIMPISTRVFFYPSNSNIHLKKHKKDLKESWGPDSVLYSLSVSLFLISFMFIKIDTIMSVASKITRTLLVYI